MGRIRTVKPEFFKHSGLFDAEQETGLPLRLGFAGLWTCCDREGRFKWRPRELKLDVLPYDDCEFSRVLDALASRGFLVRYTNGTEVFGHIPSWKAHQFINNKEAQSNLPNPIDYQRVDASVTRGERVENMSETRGVKERNEKEGEGEVIARPTTNHSEPLETSIDPHMMARGLCERLGLSMGMGQGSVYMAVCDVGQIEARRGGDLMALCDRMAEAYEAWIGTDDLEYRWGPAKFFGDGWWSKPEAWPRKTNRSSSDKDAERNQAWKEFMAKGADDGD